MGLIQGEEMDTYVLHMYYIYTTYTEKESGAFSLTCTEKPHVEEGIPEVHQCKGKVFV